MFNLTQKQKMMLLILALGCICFVALAASFTKNRNASKQIEFETKPELPQWEFQSIDTMKFSRDPAREFLDNQEEANKVITGQTAEIAAVGVTHRTGSGHATPKTGSSGRTPAEQSGR